jgi:hypothetical protein
MKSVLYDKLTVVGNQLEKLNSYVQLAVLPAVLLKQIILVSGHHNHLHSEI